MELACLQQDKATPQSPPETSLAPNQKGDVAEQDGGEGSLQAGTFIRGCWEPKLRWQNSDQTFDKTFTAAWKPKQRYSGRTTFSLGREGKVGGWEVFVRFCYFTARRRMQVDLWLVQPRVRCWYWSALSSGAATPDYSEGSVLMVPTQQSRFIACVLRDKEPKCL